MNLFRLGLAESNSLVYFNGAIDDLRIYTRVLIATEITNLFNNNATFSSNDFNTNNLKASLYPNPASNKFTIKMDSDLKSVEIYSLQSQKMISTTQKEVNVPNLSKGIYIIRIQDENNAVGKQKLIKD